MAIHYMRPDGDIVSVFTAGTYLDIDEVVPDDATTVVRGSSTTDISNYVCSMTAMASAVSIQKVTLRYRIDTNGRDTYTGIRISGTDYEDVKRTVTGYTTYTKSWTKNPKTGVDFKVAELNAIQCRHRNTTTLGTLHYLTWLELEIDYVRAPAKIEPVREAMSRRLWYGRNPTTFFTGTVFGYPGLDLRMNKYLPITWLGGPYARDTGAPPSAPDNVGWGHKNWERRRHSVVALTYNPQNDTVDLRALDYRPVNVIYRDVAWATRKGTTIADSIPRTSKSGVTRTFSRASDVYFNSPASGKVIREVVDVEAHAQYGDLHEENETNRLIHSSFAQGSGATFTGWTAAGSGTVTEETDQASLLFEPGVLAADRCPKLTAGNPISTDFTFTSTATASISNGAWWALSIDHRDNDAAKPLYWDLKRGDGLYWSVSGGQFSGSTPYWHAMTGSTDWAREIALGQMNGVGTLQLIVGVPTTGAVNQVNWVGHCQIEEDSDKASASSRIVTATTFATRSSSRLLIGQTSTQIAWNVPQGAFACEVIPHWSANKTAARNYTVLYQEHDANDYEWIYYDEPNERFVFDRTRAGTTILGYTAHTAVRGEVITLCARWTGSNTELDYLFPSPYTHDILVNGNLGFSGTAAGTPNTSYPADLEIGSKSATDMWNGQIRMIHSYPYVPTNAEASRLPR